MRRCTVRGKKRVRRRLIFWLMGAVFLIGMLWLNRYVNTTVKPTLHELAEYEARCATVQAVNRAVAAELQHTPVPGSALFTQENGVVSLNTAAAGVVQARLLCAVQAEMDALPEISYRVPFGSLTNNSLLSGIGPGWPVQLQPRGYVQGVIQAKTESLSVNTTRCRAVLRLSVTVNMILDGSTATLTVQTEYPLADVFLCGDTPAVYAADLD